MEEWICLRWVENNLLVGDSEGLELIFAFIGNVTVGSVRHDTCKHASGAESA